MPTQSNRESIFHRKKSPKGYRRVIDALRGEFPEETWTFEQPCWWRSSEGWYVVGESHYSPQTWLGEERFITRYRRSDTGEYLDWLPGSFRVYYG